MDLIGWKFGKLVVESFTVRVCGSAIWQCKCCCGNLKHVRAQHLISGGVKSCGCGIKDMWDRRKRCSRCGEKTSPCYCKRLILAEDRIFKNSYVDERGCWRWISAKLKGGYGSVRFRMNGQIVNLAHRLSYALFIGEIPETLTLDHTCNNEDCVNPHHLVPMSAGDNIRKSISLRRSACCPKGHEMTEDNIYFSKWTDVSGVERKHRLCKTCRKIRSREDKRLQRIKRPQAPSNNLLI